MTPDAIGYATSDDGIVWKRNARPIFTPREVGWDSWAIGGPSVLWDPDTLKMWYFGNPRHNIY